MSVKPQQNKNCLISDLPTYESCCKSAKRWIKRAGIDKHINWHCARHLFAVNILKQRGKYQDHSQSFRVQRIEAYREIHPCGG